jgi:hypothetical protein
LYSITTNQAAIIALFRVLNRYVGNLPPMPGAFPDYPAPVVRNAVVEPIHSKAMPVILTTAEERDVWMRARGMRSRRCKGRCRMPAATASTSYVNEKWTDGLAFV